MKRHSQSKYILKSLKEGPMEPIYVFVPADSDEEQFNPFREKKDPDGYSPTEKARYEADDLAKSYLVMSLSNDVYQKLDSYKDSAKEIWEQLERIMQASKVP